MSGREVAEKILGDQLNRWQRGDRIREIMKSQESMPAGWYACSAGIGLRSGPHKSEAAAKESLRLSKLARAEQRIKHGTDYPFPHDLKAWKEK